MGSYPGREGAAIRARARASRRPQPAHTAGRSCVGFAAGRRPSPVRRYLQEMSLDSLQEHWNALGAQDPLWAILSDPSKRAGLWRLEDFLETGRSWIAEVVRYLDEICPSAGRDRALDFGCGVGRLTQALAEHFSRCDGIDIAPSMIRQAEELN